MTVKNPDVNFAGFVMLKLISYSSLTLVYTRGEVCNKSSETAQRSICPECPEYCPVRELSESCNLYNVAYLFDNDLTVVFALFMSLWATLFMELWKRRQAVLVWEWDLQMDEQEEQTRPEFEASILYTLPTTMLVRAAKYGEEYTHRNHFPPPGRPSHIPLPLGKY